MFSSLSPMSCISYLLIENYHYFILKHYIGGEFLGLTVHFQLNPCFYLAQLYFYFMNLLSVGARI